MKKVWSFIKNIFTRDGRLRPFIIPAVILSCALVVGGIGIDRAVGVLKTFQFKTTEISRNDEDLGISVKLDAPEGITNIALFGVDSRDEEYKGLSDSIMIITIDAEHNCIKLTSIMRDSLVKIDGFGHQKINAAYNLGALKGKTGAELAIRTLNQTFNMNIRDYATVDFVSMAGIIEAVGGVEVEMTEKEVKLANIQIWDMYVTRGTPYDPIEEAGKQTLNGVQAVAFARIRKTATVTGTNNDAGRTERQRLVMRQLFEKALEMDVSKYPTMIAELAKCMETSLTEGRIFELAGILTNDGIVLKEARIPADEAIITYGLSVKGLGSCMYYNLDYAADMLNAFVFEDISFEDYMEQNGVDRTPWFFGELNEEGEEEVEEEEPEEELPNEEGGELPENPEEETPGEETDPDANPDTDPEEPNDIPEWGKPGQGNDPPEEETPPEGEQPPAEGDGTGGEQTPPEGEQPPAEEPPAENEDEIWYPGGDQSTGKENP